MLFRNRFSAASSAFRLRLPVALGLLLYTVGAPASQCGSEPVCVAAVTDSGITELQVINRAAFPVTLQLEVEPLNMRVRQAAPAPSVLQPGQRVSLVQLEVADPAARPDYRYRTRWARGDYRAAHDDSYVYRLPYRAGGGYLVTQSYNGVFSHKGDASYAVDFAMPVGTPIVAAREGVVVGVRADSTVGGPDPALESEANYVVVQHADGTFAEYLHLRPNGVRVAKGEPVERGQLLGYSGNTGFSGGPHLHFMVSGATADGGRQSFPIRFRTGEGIVAQLQVGHTYRSSDRPVPPASVIEAEGLATAIEGEAGTPPSVLPGEPAAAAEAEAAAAGAGIPQ